MQYCGLSNKGKVRGNNEDFFYVPEKDGIQVFVVCDGMGGENAGEIASALAVSEIVVYIEENFNEKDRALLLRKALLNANKTVLDTAKSDNRYDSMGTTAVCALPENDKVYIANVGDSRCYMFSDFKCEQISVDHSYVQEMVDKGVLTPEEARIHPNKNLVTRAIGVDRFINVDVFVHTWKKGDRLLLASDGLTGMVDDEKLTEIICNAKSAKDGVEALVKAANDAGGKDNITSVLIIND